MSDIYTKSKQLEKLSNIAHGFFNNQGGVSDGVYRSLNCGTYSGDKQDNVKQNKQIAMQQLGYGEFNLKTLKQIHSNKVIVINSLDDNNIYEADSLVTNQKDIVLGVLTADCCPVLFADDKNNVVAAAHAGWRGAFSGVLQNTVNEMLKLGADIENIQVALGPTIAQKSYEVDQNFFDNFPKSSQEKHFIKTGNKYLFDLPCFVKDSLLQIGINKIDDIEHNTYERPEYFSYRRTCHRNEKDFGRLLSSIVIY